MSRPALAWSDQEEVMLVWLQFCFPIESTISSGFPVISNNDLSLLAKLQNFSSLQIGWEQVRYQLRLRDVVYCGLRHPSTPSGCFHDGSRPSEAPYRGDWWSSAQTLLSKNLESPPTPYLLIHLNVMVSGAAPLPGQVGGFCHVHSLLLCSGALRGTQKQWIMCINPG